MMKTILAIAFVWILCVAGTTLASAVCAGTSVSAYGAKGDGATDDTTAIQAAINAAAAAGGGSVVFNVARYYTTGTFIVPTAVVLCGAIEGPFDVGFGVNPAATVVAPTLLVTNSTAPFITLQGVGSGVPSVRYSEKRVASSSA